MGANASASDLALLAHVRQTRDDAGKNMGDEAAVIIGNRLPRSGAWYTWALMSDTRGAVAADLEVHQEGRLVEGRMRARRQHEVAAMRLVAALRRDVAEPKVHGLQGNARARVRRLGRQQCAQRLLPTVELLAGHRRGAPDVELRDAIASLESSALNALTAIEAEQAERIARIAEKVGEQSAEAIDRSLKASITSQDSIRTATIISQ